MGPGSPPSRIEIKYKMMMMIDKFDSCIFHPMHNQLIEVKGSLGIRGLIMQSISYHCVGWFSHAHAPIVATSTRPRRGVSTQHRGTATGAGRLVESNIDAVGCRSSCIEGRHRHWQPSSRGVQHMQLRARGRCSISPRSSTKPRSSINAG